MNLYTMMQRFCWHADYVRPLRHLRNSALINFFAVLSLTFSTDSLQGKQMQRKEAATVLDLQIGLITQMA